MKTPIKYIPLVLMAAMIALGQDDAATNAPTSSLQITTERSAEERVEFLLEVARSYMRENDMESALSAFERILEIDPEHLQARHSAGHLYITTKDYAKAEALLSELIREFPDDFKLWNNLAWLYATAEDPLFKDGKKAIEYAQTAMVLAPNDYHVWSTLSEAHYVSGNYEKAYRDILHMARLAVRYGTDVTEVSVKEYNKQIQKCKRAADTAKFMKQGEEE